MSGIQESGRLPPKSELTEKESTAMKTYADLKSLKVQQITNTDVKSSESPGTFKEENSLRSIGLASTIFKTLKDVLGKDKPSPEKSLKTNLEKADGLQRKLYEAKIGNKHWGPIPPEG